MNNFANTNRVVTKRIIKTTRNDGRIKEVSSQSKRMKRLQKAYILDVNGNFDSRFFSMQTVR